MTLKNDSYRAQATEIVSMLQKYNSENLSGRWPELLADPQRFDNFSRRLPGLMFDFSRVGVDSHALDQLMALARLAGVEEQRDRLFAGDPINHTEHRPALHMALRMPEVLQAVGGEEAGRVQDAMQALMTMADTLHAGSLPTRPDQPITDVIHVGIGGSLLGPQLIGQALDGGESAVKVHMIGSVDAHQRVRLLENLAPESTVVVLVSKSFTTGDTLLHGKRLKQWLVDALGEEAANERLIAVTSNVERATAFGVDPANILYFSEWVGGRYSLWSPVSLSAVALMGTRRFRQLLEGAAEMDRHFRQAPLAENIPVLFALVGLWHRNVCGMEAWGIMPYDQRLKLLPAYLQQLIMESNGKSITNEGQPVMLGTSPVIFGESGTEAQHSVFQAMHQGSDIVPLNFIGICKPDHDDREAHDELLANLLAQVTALAAGRSKEQTRAETGLEDAALLAHRTFNGNRPSELILLDELNPHNLGLLLALYEHKVFVESVLWDINAFDQWGVELGKTLIPGIQQALAEDRDASPSLAGVMDHIRQRRGGH